MNGRMESSMGFGSFLFLIFLTLKLTDVIDWSWLWVTAPLWVGPALVAGIFTLAAVGAVIYKSLKLLSDRGL